MKQIIGYPWSMPPGDPSQMLDIYPKMGQKEPKKVQKLPKMDVFVCQNLPLRIFFITFSPVHLLGPSELFVLDPRTLIGDSVWLEALIEIKEFMDKVPNWSKVIRSLQLWLTGTSGSGQVSPDSLLVIIEITRRRIAMKNGCSDTSPGPIVPVDRCLEAVCPGRWRLSN